MTNKGGELPVPAEKLPVTTTATDNTQLDVTYLLLTIAIIMGGLVATLCVVWFWLQGLTLDPDKAFAYRLWLGISFGALVGGGVTFLAVTLRRVKQQRSAWQIALLDLIFVLLLPVVAYAIGVTVLPQ